MKSLGDYIVTSPWLSQVGADYGVGLGEHTHVQLAEAAPTTLSQAELDAFIISRIANGTLPGSLTASRSPYIYMMVFPPQTTDVSWWSATYECSGSPQPGAWHDSVDTVEAKFAYAILPTCTGEPLDWFEFAASHEFIEAATDAYVTNETPGYITPAESPWFYGGDEVADRCETFAGVVAGSHNLTRVWSNSAAAVGTDPCIPAPATPYYNVSPAGPDVTHVVTPGETITVDLAGWLTAPVPGWSSGR